MNENEIKQTAHRKSYRQTDSKASGNLPKEGGFKGGGKGC